MASWYAISVARQPTLPTLISPCYSSRSIGFSLKSRSIVPCTFTRFQHDGNRSFISGLQHQQHQQHQPVPRSSSLPDPIRKIAYAFDPSSTSSQNASPSLFPFLHPTTIPQRCVLQNVNPVNPPSKLVPWPSQLPGSLQSKYWMEAEEAAAEFARTIFKGRSQPQKYIDGVVDTSVHFGLNLIPGGSLSRAKMLTKAYVLIFMHDDAIDSGNPDLALPTINQESLIGNSGHLGFDMLAQEVLAEDSVQGKRMLEGMLSWGAETVKTRPESFSDLEEYMVHRAEDSGAYAVFRTSEFAGGVHLLDLDTTVLRRLRVLCAKHYLLTNDLYSYDKEALEEGTDGGLMNAVLVVQSLLGTPASSAKAILRQVILDIERQMGEVYGHLEGIEGTSGAQLLYAQGLVAAAAGNMYFSATSPRYARAVEGSQLPSSV